MTARLVFRPHPALDGEQAGFAVMGNDYAALRLTDTPEGALLEYIVCEGASKGAAETATELAMLPYVYSPVRRQFESKNVPLVKYADIPSVEITVKLSVRAKEADGDVPGAVCRFAWKAGEGEFMDVPGEFMASPDLWTGAKWGFFCNRFTPKNDSGSLDVRLIDKKGVTLTK